MNNLEKLAKLIRYYILVSSTEAGSGHPTSSLSATDLMTGLLFGGFFRFDLRNPKYANNDRLIFSKGHASPLFYSMWAAAGVVSEKELMTMRKFGSALEGHPTPAFKYTEAATGSLGQGLSIGVGMALNAKYVDRLPYRTYVLLGDSEMSEGAVWEAMQIAAHYKLDNLIGILDVNRLGQRGETMYGHDLKAYETRIKAFGWRTILVKDGHNLKSIIRAFKQATFPSFPSPGPADAKALAGGLGRDEGRGRKPVLIIAKTFKGHGVPYFEDKENWHGKPLSADELKKVLRDFGSVDKKVRGEIAKPEKFSIFLPKADPPLADNFQFSKKSQNPNYKIGDKLATRKAYGQALVRIFPKFPNMVVLDAEVSNSTFSEIFKAAYPERFFEMYIAEQNMVGTALGLSRRGKIPFVSTFAAFLTRAFDQIRMSQYSKANIKFCGSHAGVSIGQDGPSQMGLEDLAMFRAISGSAVLYPADAVACDKLVEEAARKNGIVYIRTTRSDTPIIYKPGTRFPIGGSKVLRTSRKDVATVVAAGITVYEALAAYEELKKEGINIRVIDLYSIKPLDVATLKKAAKETGRIITIEDHYPAGGIGEAVNSALAPIFNFSAQGGSASGGQFSIFNLAVRKMPKSGKPEELLDYEGISSKAIINVVSRFIGS